MEETESPAIRAVFEFMQKYSCAPELRAQQIRDLSRVIEVVASEIISGALPPKGWEC